VVVGPVAVDELVFETVPEAEDTIEDTLEDAAEDAAEDEEPVTEVSLYSSKRFPAPQYSYGLPGQMKLQSVSAAGTEPALRLFPQ
jgi:hypothetical protein